MNPKTIAASSLLVLGAFIAGQQSPLVYKWPVEKTLSIEGIPKPDQLWSLVKDSVQVMGEEHFVAYTVPPDKRLVITHAGLGSSPNPQSYLWRGMNGLATEKVLYHYDTTAPDPPEVSFGPGEDVIYVNPATSPSAVSVRLYGYLVEL